MSTTCQSTISPLTRTACSTEYAVPPVASTAARQSAGVAPASAAPRCACLRPHVRRCDISLLRASSGIWARVEFGPALRLATWPRTRLAGWPSRLRTETRIAPSPVPTGVTSRPNRGRLSWMPRSPCSPARSLMARRCQIAKRAGVNYGLVHYYFATKHDLLREALAAQCHSARRRPRAAASGDRGSSSTRPPTPPFARCSISPSTGTTTARCSRVPPSWAGGSSACGSCTATKPTRYDCVPRTWRRSVSRWRGSFSHPSNSPPSTRRPNTKARSQSSSKKSCGPSSRSRSDRLRTEQRGERVASAPKRVAGTTTPPDAARCTPRRGVSRCWPSAEPMASRRVPSRNVWTSTTDSCTTTSRRRASC